MNPGGTGSTCRCGARRGRAPALPVRRALAASCGGLALSPAYPAFSLISFPHPPSLRGRGRQGYFMQGLRPCIPGLNPCGTGSPCRCGARRGAAPALPVRRALAAPRGACVCRPPTPPLACFFAPFPEGKDIDPFLRGRGRLKVFYARGFALHPGLEPRRHLFALPLWCPEGACPGVAGSAGVGGTLRGLAFFVARQPCL